MAVRGYRTEEVRTYLASLAKEISWRDQEIAELQRELQRGAPRDELLEQLGMEVCTVLRSADDLQSRARDEAERIRNQAREEADGVRREAHQEIERLRADVSFLVDRFVELRDVLGQVVFGIESQLELIGEPK